MQIFSLMSVLCLTSFSALTSAFNNTDIHWNTFQQFVGQYEKTYSNLVEMEKRFDITKRKYSCPNCGHKDAIKLNEEL